MCKLNDSWSQRQSLCCGSVLWCVFKFRQIICSLTVSLPSSSPRSKSHEIPPRPRPRPHTKLCLLRESEWTGCVRRFIHVPFCFVLNDDDCFIYYILFYWCRARGSEYDVLWRARYRTPYARTGYEQAKLILFWFSRCSWAKMKSKRFSASARETLCVIISWLIVGVQILPNSITNRFDRILSAEQTNFEQKRTKQNETKKQTSKHNGIFPILNRRHFGSLNGWLRGIMKHFSSTSRHASPHFGRFCI